MTVSYSQVVNKNLQVLFVGDIISQNGYLSPPFHRVYFADGADFANEFNKTCPMNIDEYTTLKNVIALPNKTLQYNYVLVGITKAEVKLDTVKKYIFPQVLQNAKTNPGMKLFRENKVTLNYSYSDKNGKFVTNYIIKPEMYE